MESRNIIAPILESAKNKETFEAWLHDSPVVSQEEIFEQLRKEYDKALSELAEETAEITKVEVLEPDWKVRLAEGCTLNDKKKQHKFAARNYKRTHLHFMNAVTIA